jgi:predicted Abi (CAAX) family protease
MLNDLLTTVVNRFLAASSFPQLQDWLIGIIALGIYGAIALPIGFKSGFLNFNPSWGSPKSFILDSFKLLLLPGFLEEVIFRVCLIPHPLEMVSSQLWFIAATISLFLFIIAHPINALILYKAANPTFLRPIFLFLAGLLGLSCTIIYQLTGSLWVIMLFHWIVVMIWWFTLDAPVRVFVKNN